MLSVDQIRELLIGDCPERCAAYARAIARTRDSRIPKKIIRLAGHAAPKNIRMETNLRRAIHGN